MMDKLVSVIMPIYNPEITYLLIAINSILNQTYKNLELILVDSSDRSEIGKLILEQSDSRICYNFREKNGVSDALNYGLEIAKGEYIARMDSDDISLPTRLEKQVAFLERFQDIDVIGTYIDRIDFKGKVIEHKSTLESGDYESIKSNMIFDNPIAHPTVMFRRKIIEAGWRYRDMYAEDHDLWSRMLPAIKIANMEEKLVHYRQYEGNTSFQIQRYSMVLDVVESTKKYVENMFCIDTKTYKNEDFFKTYYLYFLNDDIRKNLTNYIMGQFALLYQIYQKNEEMHVVETRPLVSALNNRWQKIMDLADCLFPELNNIYKALKFTMPKGIFFANYIAKIYNFDATDHMKIFAKLQDVFYRNELLLKEQFSKSKNFLIYGMGEQGRLVLEKCEQLTKENKFSWNLKGIVDRRKLEIAFMGSKYDSLTKEQIKDIDFDYIIISSAWYFEDIKEELLELGVEERAIIRDGGLYLIE